MLKGKTPKVSIVISRLLVVYTQAAEHLQDTVLLHWSSDLWACYYSCIDPHKVCSNKRLRFTATSFFTRSHPNVIAPMKSSKGELWTSYDL